MKATILLCLLMIFKLSAQQHNYTFSELKGIEDYEQKTHLLYRLYTFEEGGGPIGDYYENSIYHLDIGSEEDSLFLFEGGRILENVTRIVDLEFWNNNPAEFIYTGEQISVDPVAFIQRYDQTSPSNTMLGEAYNLELGKQNSSIVIASAPNLIKSTDAGFNWLPYLDSSYVRIVSISPFNDDEIFFESNGFDLLKTTDGGQTISVVDTNHSCSQFFYDRDSIHIYSLGNNELKVSDDRGNPFSWSTRYTSSNRIYVSPDYTVPGELYLADGNTIYVSDDYGQTFNEYKTLDRKIVGIYRKPSEGGYNILYAATKYKIYKITPDTILFVKEIPIPKEVYDWYPLNQGNKSIYNFTFYGDTGDSIRSISINEVTGYKIINSQVFNEVLIHEIPIDSGGHSGTHYEYFHVDSAEGKIYKAEIENDSLLSEELYTDLLAEVGDTIPVGNGIYLDSEVPITIFELESRERTFYHTLTPVQDTRFVNGLGLVYEYIWELVGEKSVLQGCIIDGEVYGDTNVVSVEDNINEMPTKFSLSQNYPNPFNPSTKIKFTIPSSPLSFGEGQGVRLIVYDILGNEILTLVNEEKPAGTYEVEFDVSNLPSGIYFYQLKAGNFIQTKKMILLK